MNILAISGSFRAQSQNRALLEKIGSRLSRTSLFRLFDEAGAIPVFNEDMESAAPVSVRSLWRMTREADLLMFATPEYNQSLPGGLKNIIDWITRDPSGSPLQGKPCAVTGATVGHWGTRIAQQQLRTILQTCGARVLPAQLFVAQSHNGLPDDEALDGYVNAISASVNKP